MKLIGRSDRVDFPELHLRNINIKIDTGAFTTSIHSRDVEEIELNGEKHVIAPFDCFIFGLNTAPMVYKGDAIFHVSCETN